MALRIIVQQSQTQINQARKWSFNHFFGLNYFGQKSLEKRNYYRAFNHPLKLKGKTI